MRFIDEVKVYLTGGRGGDGCVGWRREKYVPLGGPDGGEGGCGGAVIFVTDPGLNTLVDFAFQPHLKAGDGAPGGTQNITGRSGDDAVFRVPVGTQVFYRDRMVADLSTPGAKWIAARGGHGGKGNSFFRSPTNQAPDYAQPGQEGDTVELTLILKSVADVGLIGFPNVGKSSLISTVSEARPKIADYPFTTLEPNLGVAMLSDNRRLVIADIPGLIVGAHSGKGLGLQFLKHIERTSVLAQLIDIGVDQQGNVIDRTEFSDEEVIDAVTEQFTAIENELRLYSPTLAEVSRVVVFSKADLPLSRRAYELTRERLVTAGHEVHLVSSTTVTGIPELLDGLYAAKVTRQI